MSTRHVTHEIYLPSPDEIRFGCWGIQKTWTTAERRSRSLGLDGAADVFVTACPVDAPSEWEDEAQVA